MSRVGNQPCGCGSGKKYKRCCKPKPERFGPCFNERCPSDACGELVCFFCSKKFPRCERHKADADLCMRGHTFREHPSMVPDAVRKLRQNTEELKALYVKANQEPELWRTLVEFIAEQEAKDMRDAQAHQALVAAPLRLPDPTPRLARRGARVAVSLAVGLVATAAVIGLRVLIH